MNEMEGKTVGDYQLLEVLDRKGETFILKGFHAKMNRYAAVKVLSPNAMRNPVEVEEFKRQTELSAQVEHRNILPVWDSGESDGVVYRATRFVESGSLHDHLSWFYDLNKAFGLFRGIGTGLQAIHSKGIVHGNLKPSNVLIDEDKVPLLSDFGVPTRTGAPATPYNSPEQVQGANVDKRTDIYALGALLYEVLTGEPPTSGTVASPRGRRPDLPEAVDRLVLKAMAQNPADRFSSTTEFLNAFESSLQASQPVPGVPAAGQTPPPAQPKPQQKKDRSWVVFLLGAVFILCLVGGGIGLYSQYGNGADGGEPPPAEEAAPPEAPPEQPPAPPPEEPPSEPPAEPPDDAPAVSQPIALPGVCSSIGGAAGMVVVGLTLAGRERKRKKER